MTQGLVILMALTCSLTQIFTFEKQTKDFEQENGFCMKSMVFCYLYELFWEMHLLFCKSQFWSEKCTKATEKNCKALDAKPNWMSRPLSLSQSPDPGVRLEAGYSLPHASLLGEGEHQGRGKGWRRWRRGFVIENKSRDVYLSRPCVFNAFPP